MNQMLSRLLNIKLPKGQSAFLWGPRKTGKTTYLSAAFSKKIFVFCRGVIF
jgi:predicted AAA+ superfamily ATPase